MAARKRQEEPEEHENHERWLVTFADMMTLLFAFFVVLFAMSSVDAKKFEQFKAGMSNHSSEGAVSPVKEGGVGILQGGANIEKAALNLTQTVKNALAAAGNGTGTGKGNARADPLVTAQTTIENHLAAAGQAGAAAFRREDRGLVVTILTDDLLFDTGSSSLRPEGKAVLDTLAPVLRDLPNHVAIEGHTDSRPLHSSSKTNWELSTERSTSVLRYLLERHGLAPERVSASGYADQRPLAANDSDEHRALNRRVEVVVLTPSQPKAEAASSSNNHA